ncbi:serine hydrolase [Streptomyces sp. NPDC056061]|uniref:serine hydrolase n=1 Tax=Streptomyces sp. NPDC056061 TaxID=3345700 RepID=UPI0035D6D772
MHSSCRFHRHCPESPLPGSLPPRGGWGTGDGRHITIGQLLQHTSGLSDHMDALDAQPPARWEQHDFASREVVALALGLPHPTGRWTYSTTDYIILGMLIQQVTGRPATEGTTRRIIRPLGLRDTYRPGTERGTRGLHPHGCALSRRHGHTVRIDATRANVTPGGTVVPSSPHRRTGTGSRRPVRRPSVASCVAGPHAHDGSGRPGPGVARGTLRAGAGLHPVAVRRPLLGARRRHPRPLHRGRVAPDGRRVQLVLNQDVTTEQAFHDERQTVERALCENR